MFGIHVRVVHGGGAHIVLGGGPCVVYHDVLCLGNHCLCMGNHRLYTGA